jgi:hypothetical protein
MRKEESKINCPTFQKQELIIKALTDKINKTKEMQEKIRFSEELEKEINVLLNCPDYNEAGLYCGSCHFIADLRKRTIELIKKAKKLA